MFQQRIRLVIEEDEPVFESWNSHGHMEANYAPEPEIEVLAETFMRTREQTVELFKALTTEQWARTGTWPDGRVVDLAWLAEKCLWHALDHFASLLDMHGEFDATQAQRWLGNTPD
jgi:hypothetical protein